uniref:Phlebovirus glycoprotein G2 fusion domain-containing protein n=1 Tax=Panagrolaimus superbus TaxID=310955 RepID=A0A914ZHU8_9BILA
MCLDRTWIRWRKEYLTKLRETSQNLHNQKGIDLIPEVGEIVLIEEDEVPRGRWRMGKITEVNKSRDGHIRAVVVQTANGHLLNRSPAHLYPLEANLDPESRKTIKSKDSTSDVQCQTNKVVQNKKPPLVPENRRVTRSMKSNVNSLFFFLTLCQLFLLSIAGAPIIEEAYCKNGEIITKTLNVTKISIHLPERSKLIQVNESTSIIPIPSELLTSHSIFETIFWSNTGDSFTLNLECGFTDFCQLVTCVFCTDHITHPQCWEWTTWMFLFITCIILIVMCLRKCTQTHAPLLFKIVIWFFRNTMKQPNNTVNTGIEESSAPDFSSGKNIDKKPAFKPSLDYIQQNAIMFAVIMLCLFNLASACSDSSVIQAKSESCFMTTGNHINCNFSTKSWMSVSSAKDACLLLQSDEKIPVGSVKISVKAFASCKKYYLGTTKFMQIKVKSAKRCPGMGSCTNNNCAEVTDQSHIEELGIANDYPGVTECVESCGSISCGCALFGTGCTFYRYYAESESDDKYKLFTCPQWEAYYNITVTLDTHNSSVSRVFKVKPGQTVQVDDIKISVRKASVEFLRTFPTDVAFMERDNEIAWLSDEAYQESRLLSCSNFQGCILRHNSCNCHAADSTVQCSCDDQEEMKHEWVKNKLPSLIGEHLFMPNQMNNPTALVLADIDLMVETHNLSASTLIHYTDCSIVNASVSGTNGPDGAILKTFCKTQFGSSVGHVYCNNQIFDVKCSKNGTWTERRWFTNDVTINEECTLACQVSEHHFKIKGHLHQKKHSDEWRKIHGKGEDNTSSLKEFGLGVLAVFQHLYDYILYIIAGVIVILVIVLLLK